jgi:hypothetical protein
MWSRLTQYMKVGVLKQYRVNGIDDLVNDQALPEPNLSPAFDVNNNSISRLSTSTAPDRNQHIAGFMDSAGNYDIWPEFFAAIPEMDDAEGYNQLFAGLDFYCAPT